MKAYIKRPVVIVATQFWNTEESIQELREFCKGAFLGISGKEALIGTLEDGALGQAKHVASEGDYIIRGVRGAFYACKPDIFALTYEEYTP